MAKCTIKKQKKPCKGDRISEALSTFAEVQREQQQLVIEIWRKDGPKLNWSWKNYQ